MKKNKLKKKADNPVIISKETKDKLWKHKIVQEVIDSGHPAHVRYISPLPRGDGKIHSCKGRVVSQDVIYMFVKRPHSSKVRILKSQMFLMTTHRKKRRSRTRKVQGENDKI